MIPSLRSLYHNRVLFLYRYKISTNLSPYSTLWFNTQTNRQIEVLYLIVCENDLCLAIIVSLQQYANVRYREYSYGIQPTFVRHTCVPIQMGRSDGRNTDGVIHFKFSGQLVSGASL